MFQSEFSPFEQVEKHYGGKILLPPTIQLELLETGRKVEAMEDKGAADGRIHLMARWDPHGVASYPSQFYVVKAKGVLLHIDARYQQLKPIGNGNYGIVCSALDAVPFTATA